MKKMMVLGAVLSSVCFIKASEYPYDAETKHGKKETPTLPELLAYALPGSSLDAAIQRWQKDQNTQKNTLRKSNDSLRASR